MLSAVRRLRPRFPRAALTLLVALLGVLASGCRGYVNDSPNLRWWLFANFGASRICPEMTKTSIGLALADGGPKVGRFFPTGCQMEVHGETNSIIVRFWGTGYAYVPVAKRVGFEGQAAVEYRPDFFLADDSKMYVWGRVGRMVEPPTFKLGHVESPIAGAMSSVLPVNQIGNQLAASHLAQGFTVLVDEDTESKTFALGIIQPPSKPRTPFQLRDDDVYTFANETIEVQNGERDYLGPFEVVDSDQELSLRAFVQGPNVEAIVVNKAVGDAWRTEFQRGQLGPPPGPIAAGAPLPGGSESRPAFRVPPGQYYVVIDHTAVAGQVQPPARSILDATGVVGAVARISYAAMLREY